jgi:putative ABC transport system ATP-binding protein
MKTAFLLLDKLSFFYPSDPENTVFESLAAKIPLDSETLILGGNASGKSTLAKLLGCLDEPTGGKIVWPQTRQSGKSPGWEPIRAGVVFEIPGFQFQSFYVKEELEAGLIYRGAGTGERKRAISKAAEELGLEPYLEMGVQDLEAPVQLAVLVASFLLLSPRLLVLDFSLALLEKAFRERLLNECRAPSGPALVVLSRQADDLALIGSRASVFFISKGTLKELTIPRDDPQVLTNLESADICIPWYATLAASLQREGLTSRIFYENEKDFIGEVNAAVRRKTGCDPANRGSR